ncbi:hypothetical protein CRN76_04920 [Chryseobacterium indologenes]|uniref:c-type cytochrome n=1 Tax=Chryseobacterium indologenes TaxID=253 RepID=UPI000BFC4ED7|nr:c-type cytochrome [Chryseobacterium indologenes]ATN04791.1 hypothetical protein CRN76_04920 [Chryseobacterium indologenes]AYY86458.1 hypothetical protein EGX91_18845 [Chryseobacterium indologenes]QIX83350.1 c-type cytochrome [Chryseobacterium indologenes]HAO27237.1 hypothetical protein [Chryseobacterium indologenes]
MKQHLFPSRYLLQSNLSNNPLLILSLLLRQMLLMIRGFKLIEGADCLACHKIDSKLIGPSYQDVASKYTKADIERLAQKIIEGGKGNWGDIPMTPHEGLSKDDAQQMVKYILSLKK